jgi:hypothetical protein
MDITAELTVQKFTPPGYFNLSEDAPAFHKAYIAWWNAILLRRAGQANDLRSLILTPWLVDHPASPRTTWLKYLLGQYGMSYFGGTNNQAAVVYKLVSNAWARSVITNILTVIQTLCLPPFSWFESPTITTNYYVPLDIDTGFIIYSTAGSLPSTPAATAYAARGWAVPAGWAKVASSATYYARGYISGSNVVWSIPRPVSDFENPRVLSASIPIVVASVGTVCIVYNDSTGDYNAVYYSDGTVWRKNSIVNADLGDVTPGSTVRPDPEAIGVWAPNPALVTYPVTSDMPPPVTGASAGHGTFAGWTPIAIEAGQEIITLHQLAGGSIAIATLFDLLRRVKPVNKTFRVELDSVSYTISDIRQA